MGGFGCIGLGFSLYEWFLFSGLGGLGTVMTPSSSDNKGRLEDTIIRFHFFNPH